MWKSKSAFVCSILISIAGADSSSYLSPNQQQLLELERKQAKENANALRYDWVSPWQLSYSHSVADDGSPAQRSDNWVITASQPVFKSGGIYYGIKYADATESYSYQSIDIEEKTLITQVIDLILQLHAIDLQQARQQRLIDNGKINVLRKTEQFQSGFLDSSFLDQAILELNALEVAAAELEESRFMLLAELRNLSDADYQNITIPEFLLMDEDAFLTANSQIRQQRQLTEQQRYKNLGTVTLFLPTVSLEASYSDSRVRYPLESSQPRYENSYSTYGVTVSMPILDVNTFNDIEVARIDYLKASIGVQEKQRQEENLYRRTLAQLQAIDTKVALARNSQQQYESLVEDAKAKLDAGEGTTYDVQTLENSYQTKRLDEQLYAIERQRQLLTLVSRMSGAM